MKLTFTLITLFFTSFTFSQTITLDITVILEGAHTGSQPPMNTYLRDYGLVPLSHPYNPTIPFHGNNNPVWLHNGNESVSNMPSDIVDWVLIELRDAPSASSAYAGTTVAKKAALLKSNGKITATNGLLPVFNIDIQHNIFVVIHHRNHLSVMSSQPLTLSSGKYSWNFTQTSGNAYGNGHKHLGNGVYAMAGGDANANGQIQLQDVNDVWFIQAGQNGYFAADFDLNGQVQAQDLNNIWDQNAGLATQIPAGSSYAQPCPDMPTFTDPRNGITYNTIQIGNQCWLKENLKYLPWVNTATDLSNSAARYYVYGYNGSNTSQAMATDNFQNYGVLYNYNAAKTACPAGWHLPSNNEWSMLIDYLIQEYNLTNEDDDLNGIGNKLKSCRQVDSPLGGYCNTLLHPRWDNDIHHGTDEFGFSALPAGALNPDEGIFDFLGQGAAWWSNDALSWPLNNYAHFWGIAFVQGSINSTYYLKGGGASVRCLLNQ